MTTARMPLMAGNWKMNLNHLEAISLVQKLAFSLDDKDFDRVEVAVIPPYTDIRSVQTMVDGDRLRLVYGAQDLSPHDGGAHTGDISGPLLKALGCTYVVVGHSERRTDHAEDDETVRRKVLAAGRHGLVPILCVGEGLEIRQAGGHVPHCVSQLKAALIDVPEAVLSTLVVAYEPVWAIGTGEVATPDDAQEVCAEVRRTLAEVAGDAVAQAARVLYGGSVKADNVGAIMAMADVDGALVGGASLDAEEFTKICRFEAAAAG